MTDNDPTAPVPAEPEPDEDPGYLIETGQAVAADGTVAPIIGGLPAVEGSAWDIGAPAEDRGAGLAEDLARQADEDHGRPAGEEQGHPAGEEMPPG